MNITKLIGGLLSAIALAATAADFDPQTGFRVHNYTQPTPEQVPGGTTIDAGQAHVLWESGALSIDVLSITTGRYDELDGTWPDHPTRMSIPGSLWLPNVGFGRPEDDMQAYLQENLAERLKTLNDPVVVFCIDSCWMGWNAAQHVSNFGYSKVYWFPQGTDAWESEGFPMAQSEPLAVNLD